jgi:hypothetical protein
MSPEAAMRGKMRLDPKKSDIYSMALILWFLWHRRHPFQQYASNPYELIVRVRLTRVAWAMHNRLSLSASPDRDSRDLDYLYALITGIVGMNHHDHCACDVRLQPLRAHRTGACGGAKSNLRLCLRR